MKKILSLITLLSLLVFGIVGCGNKVSMVDAPEDEETLAMMEEYEEYIYYMSEHYFALKIEAYGDDFVSSKPTRSMKKVDKKINKKLGKLADDKATLQEDRGWQYSVWEMDVDKKKDGEVLEIDSLVVFAHEDLGIREEFEIEYILVQDGGQYIIKDYSFN